MNLEADALNVEAVVLNVEADALNLEADIVLREAAGVDCQAAVVLCERPGCWLSPTPNEARMYASSAPDARIHTSGESMADKAKQDDAMRDLYDFSGCQRGKYASRYPEGTNVVVLAPDVAAMFPDSIAVNEALRTFVRMSARTVGAKAVPKKRGG